jgi:tRNA A-37 threonylcarbamoyl transferase component Bud32
MNERAEELLSDYLLQWEELKEKGQDTPASELAKDHPDLIDELAIRIAALKATEWLDTPLDDDPLGDDSPAPPPITPKTLAGRYRLDDLIAEGGFAQVYRAYDTELQRTVAIKIPKPSKLESKEAFQAEARRVARLKHDNIVPVYDVGLEGDTCFIVTEYVEGGSLADRLVQGNPSRAEAIRWVCEIADALEYAHLHGVIHLDIKPANILIEAHGRATLADFGIARSAMKTGEFAPSLGTLRYMSPEQLEGKPADHRSDIYSLAVVLYELLTGRIPYSSSEPNVLRKEIVQGPKQVQWSRIPAALRSVCERTLSRRPHERPTSAAAFTAEVRRAGTKQNWPRFVGWLALMSALGAGWFMIPMPHPAPYTGVRRHWEGSNGVCFVHYPDEKQWKEQDEHGEAFFWFTEHARTPEYIELLDESRNLLIRLYDDRVAVKRNVEKAAWGVMRNGTWLPKQEN